MNNSSVIQPALLSRINERQVLRAIQARGPLSRAEVARHSGITAPTASKAVDSLLRAGLLEEADAEVTARGRPGKKLRLATSNAQVLGLVIDAGNSRVVSAGLDGRVRDERTIEFPTPDSYPELLSAAADSVRSLMGGADVATLGVGISLPGLIDYRRRLALLSPNVPVTDGQSPARDLSEMLDVECVMVQESHALCLAERYYGDAKGVDDFAMLDVGTGVGLGVMSGGRLLTGHSGLAGELGHITADVDGRLCGCGNRGCLETLASDSALAGAVSRRIGREVDVEGAAALVRDGHPAAREELERACRYLAVGIAAVVNLFNPSTLFVHGRMFAADEGLFARVVEESRRRALPPSFADCRILQARGSKRQGAVAAIIEHVTTAMGPTLAPVPRYHANGHPERVESGYSVTGAHL